MPSQIHLTLVLPCYNVERYVGECLDSIYCQNVREDLFEVICVDDRSTDATNIILHDYLTRQKNIRLIEHSENLGVSAARNSGLRAAEGAYVWFVDPDDIIAADSLSVLLRYIEYSLDILFFNYSEISSGVENNRQAVIPESKIVPGIQYVESHFPGRISKLGIVWRAIFKKQFLIEKQIFFPPICIGEDSLFVWKALILSDRVMSIARFCYIYRKNDYSISSRSSSAKSLFEGRIIFAGELIPLLGKAKERSEIVSHDLESCIIWGGNNNIKIVSQLPKDERRAYYGMICSRRKDVALLSRYLKPRGKLFFCTCGGFSIWDMKLHILSISHS